MATDDDIFCVRIIATIFQVRYLNSAKIASAVNTITNDGITCYRW